MNENHVQTCDGNVDGFQSGVYSWEWLLEKNCKYSIKTNREGSFMCTVIALFWMFIGLNCGGLECTLPTCV